MKISRHTYKQEGGKKAISVEQVVMFAKVQLYTSPKYPEKFASVQIMDLIMDIVQIQSCSYLK